MVESSNKTAVVTPEKLFEKLKKRSLAISSGSGVADSMYDLPQAVVCRCMTPCIVKVLSDQWFLNYSDPEWKAKAKDVIAQMKIYPDTATSWFIAVIDWLKEWACARTTGFGTPLPGEKAGLSRH